MLFIYLAILLIALYGVSKILMPEMAKPPLPKTPVVPDLADDPLRSQENEKQVELLGSLVMEKNRQIGLLQTELKVLDVQVRSFDKVKTLLDGEILRLREQNRIFRSELGLPPVQTKENSIK